MESSLKHGLLKCTLVVAFQVGPCLHSSFFFIFLYFFFAFFVGLENSVVTSMMTNDQLKCVCQVFDLKGQEVRSEPGIVIKQAST